MTDLRRSAESVRPPRRAESLLRLLLRPADVETVSGDLIEEYRDVVYPSLGQWRADVWFVRQVAGFAWRVTWFWGLLLAVLTLGRDALDWFSPPANFMTRSIVTTYAAASVFVGCGILTAYRTRSLRASALAGFAVGAIAAPLKVAGALILLAIWHDERTMWAIDRSGGLGEVFELPVFLFLPGVFLALVGGLLGKVGAWAFRTSPAS